MRRVLLRAAAAAMLAAVCAGTMAQALPQSRDAYLQRFDSDADGRVSVAEYVHYLSAGFHAMDRDGDGILAPSELPGGRGHAITLAEREQDLRVQFRRLDRNHDHYLDARELTAPHG